MKFRTFLTIKKLIRKAERISREYDTVSFDLFDTLVIRRIHDPDLIKEPVARFIASEAAKLGDDSWSWRRVQKTRDHIEGMHRKKTGMKYDDQEARYTDFMPEVLHEIFKENLRPDMLQRVTEYELQIENAMIVPRAAFISFLKKLHNQKKKILVVSDIYLPSSHLKIIVKHAGFIEYVDHIVSSADTFYAKASGKAFPMLRDKYNLDYKKWLHIGDNPISDGLRPAEFGIRSLVLKDVSEKKRKAISRMYRIFSDSRPFWKGRFLHQLMLPLENENIPKNPLYVEGYNFLGPLVGAFIKGILERSRAFNIKRIYFLSREGWTFKKYWERCVHIMFPDDNFAENSYLYVSRLALAGACCAYQGLTQTNADIAFLPSSNRDMRDLCRVFSLDIKGIKPFLKRYQLKEDDPLSPLYPGYSNKIRIDFMDLIEDPEFQNEIKKQTKPLNDALQAYLEQEAFFEQKDVAVVDVGWLGTIPRFLFEAVKHRKDCPSFHGFLFGASRGIKYPTGPKNYIDGVIYDRHKFEFASSTLSYYLDFFEEAFRAPHPSLKGYTIKDNNPELIFRTMDDLEARKELKQDEYFKPLQEGMLDAAYRFGAASAVLDYSIDELKPWINYLVVSKIGFPKTKEVGLYKHKHHLDDFGGDNKPPIKVKKSKKGLWFRSINMLRWNPFIRLRYYISHAMRKLRE